MFWTLVLAHLTADYPLQTDRLVMAKKHLPGLLIHVGIHLAVMLIFFIPVLGIAWPYLVVIAVAHFCIDAFKNLMGRLRPQWVIGSYVFDQILHFSSLILVAVWMERTTDLPMWPVYSPGVVYAIGVLTATYIWFITERILVYKIDNRQIEVKSTMWPRMGTRLLLFILLAAPFTYTLFLALLAIFIITLLYRRYNYLRSWLFVDIGVAAVMALIVRAILMIW